MSRGFWTRVVDVLASATPGHVIPYRPQRGDDVHRWLLAWCVANRRTAGEQSTVWTVLNELVNDYTAHADSSVPLGVLLEEKDVDLR